ncbi:MAG: PrsW family intramembrane metalloprotease [Lentimicrobium sp.]|nr:PrsW family intramembrane metalloprotease [Lentimicrobium sp.]
MKEILSLLISPLIFLLLFLYLKYRYPQGHFKLFFKAFGLGLMMAIPVIIADQVAHYLNLDGAISIRRMFMYSFVFVGFIFELSKFIPLATKIIKHHSFNGVPDGIIYTLAISTGITTLYAIYYQYFGLKVPGDEIYMLVIGPMNTLLAVILGFFAGMGKIRNNRFIDSMTGLGAASFLHGLFRFTLLSNDPMFFYLVAGGILFIAMILLRKSLTTPPESY